MITENKENDTITITDKCVVTGEDYSVIIPLQEFVNYSKGMLIQDAMPSLSAEDREFLISRTSPKGWKKIFK